MSPITLFLTQLLPLIVFVVVDAFVTDVRISILSAILFAVGQLVLTWIRSRRFDWFVLVDVGLIAGLGGISIAFDDELFFKVKPAIMEGVTLVVLLGLILAPSRFLRAYVGRMTPGTPLDDAAVGAMKSMLGVLGACVVVHVGAVLYAAFRASREAWAFVSGPGFYLFLLPVGLVALAARRKRRAGAEALAGEASER